MAAASADTANSVLGEVRPEHGVPARDLVELHYQRSFAQPVLAVWAAITEPQRVAAWLGSIEDGQLTPFDGPVDGPIAVRVEHREAPHALTVLLDGSALEVRLRHVGVVTTVELSRRHVGQQEARELGPRWQFLLDRLRAHLEERELPRWEPYAALADEYR
ncbi:hypothetical protein [Nocardia asteroides]|uniref:hypothetical protein n=1 Tax=Nocardia asteroides TaxID=1824 RepID=UPI001E30A748|nr:hypothetical protein [Nocardia asteroides]UGT63208.1 hypothetical protein LTT61_07780 [Nocardia asteroides]